MSSDFFEVLISISSPLSEPVPAANSHQHNFFSQIKSSCVLRAMELAHESQGKCMVPLYILQHLHAKREALPEKCVLTNALVESLILF